MRSKFRARTMVALHSEAANLDTETGPPVTVVTLADPVNADVLPVTLTMEETRKLVVGLLTALWTNDDCVAESLLSQNFSVGDDGSYRWPDEEGA